MLRPVQKYLPFLPIGALLLLGLYLRLANLSTIQHFQTDQGRDYMVVMDWLWFGQWPLLGPMRVVGDYAIGPGWFYVLAPALGLSGFHPAAGAGTIGVFSIVAALLAWFWIWKGTGSHLAALAAAAVLVLSPFGLNRHRTLWNPNLMPFAAAALACLIQALPRRPLPCAALTLMLYAILPQWHTTGVLLVLASLPWFAWTLWRAWPALRQSSPRARRAWGVALVAWLVLLYLPPIIYEFKPGERSNMAGYLTRTFLPEKPLAQAAAPVPPLAERAQAAADRLDSLFFSQNLAPSPLVERPALRWAVTGLLLALFLLVASLQLRQRQFDPSVAYLVSLVAGYALVLTLKGDRMHDYFLMPVLSAPVLLTGWAAGRLLKAPEGVGWSDLRRAGRGAGGVVALGGLALALWGLPACWGQHLGRTWFGQAFVKTQAVASFIAQDTGQKKFSLMLVEPGNNTVHYHYLLNYLGHRPKNHDYFSRRIERKRLGELLYVIVKGKYMDRPPVLKDWSGPIEPPQRCEDTVIYRIVKNRLPKSISALKFERDETDWTIKAEHARAK